MRLYRYNPFVSAQCRKRYLLRLWLNVENGRPVDPEAFPYRHGVPVGQARSTAHNAR